MQHNDVVDLYFAIKRKEGMSYTDIVKVICDTLDIQYNKSYITRWRDKKQVTPEIVHVMQEQVLKQAFDLAGIKTANSKQRTLLQLLRSPNKIL
ncbi:hypothetical protein A1QO_06245 [Vibrio genomosp. F10 str. ZF-129]|uniref:Uncharacterized protein n=1 Tax=Vibrio genomosp. F10 str. ZF-129 TaxID=1187848 RepID=A0A1E5BG37_9VIBR|nr:hypothetical protein [Vibrio genomosp. F10]OEE34982.1 hypothetical protein A1QO_06245 [Vibrio genomosp. F10 str. ZF-129]